MTWAQTWAEISVQLPIGYLLASFLVPLVLGYIIGRLAFEIYFWNRRRKWNNERGKLLKEMDDYMANKFSDDPVHSDRHTPLS